MELHHCAYTITKGYSSVIQEFFEYLGAKLIWEGEDQGREITMQFDNGFSIQFSEIDEKPMELNNKQETHLAFSSDKPEEEIVRMSEWFKEKGVKINTGKWGDDERWIDCPDIFLNFVIEVLKV